MTRHTPLREHLVQRMNAGGSLPANYLPDAVLLSAFSEALAHAARNREATRAILAALVLGALLALTTTDSDLCAIIALGSLGPLTALGRYWLQYHRRIQRLTREVWWQIQASLLPDATPEMVPDLLRLSQVQRSLSTNPLLPRDPESYDAYLHTLAALQTLLPRFPPTEPLSAEHRRALRHLILCYNQTRPTFAVAALLLLGESSDASLRSQARRWSERHPDERFQEAVVEYLRATEKAP